MALSLTAFIRLISLGNCLKVIFGLKYSRMDHSKNCKNCVKISKNSIHSKHSKNCGK